MRACLHLLGLATALTISAAPRPASAYCIGSDASAPGYDPQYYSVSHELLRSQYVVRAKVLDEVWIGEDGRPKPLKPPFQFGGSRPWGFDPYVGAFYSLRVETVLKGKPSRIIRVFSENSTARFWLKKGDEILAFVATGPFDKPIGRQLTLDTCGNFALYPKAQLVEQQVLRARNAKH